MTKHTEETCDHICTSNCRREGCNCECGEWHEETKHIEEIVEKICQEFEDFGNIEYRSSKTNELLNPTEILLTTLTTLSIKIHEEAIKELEGRKQTDENQMSYDHAFDEGINEAITYHKEEIMKLAEPKAIYAKTNEGDVYLKD